MDFALGWLLATGVVTVTVALLAGSLVAWAGRRGRRRLERDLAAARRELDVVHERLDDLARRSGGGLSAAASAPVEPPEFVVTTAAAETVSTDLTEPPPALSAAGRLPARSFATQAVSESVVTVAALAHGLRRALSADHRQRILFEMRREVRRSRKQRRRDERQARRHLRTQALRPLSPGGAEDAA